MTAVLSATDLSKAFGALVVTDGVSLDLRPGECHALIGPNGAGKTTLIDQLSGRQPSDAGRIVFAGEDVTALPLHERAARGLMRTFQITSLIDGFTVTDQVALAAQAKSGSSFRFFRPARSETDLNEKAIAALARTGLADRAQSRVADLSHGEKRLLEIAVALAGQPGALLADEPLAGLGQGESADLITLLGALKARCPILPVEHDMDAVFALADRISVLVYGRIIASGTPDEIRNDPATRAAYLGEDA